MEVVAIGGSVPADEATILEFGEDHVEFIFCGVGFFRPFIFGGLKNFLDFGVLAWRGGPRRSRPTFNEKRMQCAPCGRHAESAEGVEDFALLFVEALEGVLQYMRFG